VTVIGHLTGNSPFSGLKLMVVDLYITGREREEDK
jgi:hypothetical protein